jgi:hypothetical protein
MPDHVNSSTHGSEDFWLAGSVVGQLHEVGGEWFGFDELKLSLWQASRAQRYSVSEHDGVDGHK